MGLLARLEFKWREERLEAEREVCLVFEFGEGLPRLGGGVEGIKVYAVDASVGRNDLMGVSSSADCDELTPIHVDVQPEEMVGLVEHRKGVGGGVGQHRYDELRRQIREGIESELERRTTRLAVSRDVDDS